MRSILVTAIGFAVMLTHTASAQPPLDFDYSFGDSLTLLRLEEVHTDLKLTADQFARIKEVLKPVREKYVKQASILLKGSSEKEGDKLLDKLQEEIKEEGLRGVEKVLNPAQFRRLGQLCIQQRGYKAFLDKRVQLSLKLTDGQLKQLPMLLEEHDKKFTNLLRSYSFEGRQRLDRETTAAHVGILTPEQKKQWEELVGPELKINRFGILQRLK